VDARDLVSNLLYQQRKGTGLAFIIEVDGQLAGQINVANILYGSGFIGKRRLLDRLKTLPAAELCRLPVALTIDHLFDEKAPSQGRNRYQA
jgi:hypothetical protein